jgi:hypothetical protein
MISEVEYIISYCVFVFFFIFMITQGAPTFLPPESVAELQNIQVTRTITPPEYITTFPCGWGIFDFICQFLFGFVKVLWNIGIFFYWLFTTIWDTIQVLFILLRFSSSVRWVTLLIILPMTIGLLYVIIRLLRGGG